MIQYCMYSGILNYLLILELSLQRNEIRVRFVALVFPAIVENSLYGMG